MFRGKDFSNRIELSWLVQDVLKFHCFGCYPPLGGGGLVGGWVGGWGCWWVVGWVDGGVGGWGWPPHTRTHARTHKHVHVCTINMIISCKWLLPLGYPIGIPYDVIHTCICMCVHASVVVVATHPHPHLPTHPPLRGVPPQISKNSIKIERI